MSVGGHLTVRADLLLGPLVYPLVLAEVEGEGLHVADLGLWLDHVDRLLLWLSLICHMLLGVTSYGSVIIQ